MQMKRIFILLFLSISFICCNSNERNPSKKNEIINNIASDTTSSQTSDISEEKLMVGKRIYGDFNGDSKYEYAYVEFLKEVNGPTPQDDNGTYPIFAIKFSDEEIPPFDIGCCEATLINEGDLNNDGSDEISIFQSPMNGCTYVWRTINLKNDTAYNIFELFLIPTGCDSEITEDYLQNIVTLEDGKVYYKEKDPNDENVHKREAILLTK